MIDQLYQIMAVLLTVGGVGVLNYIIAEKLDAIDIAQQGSNREKAVSLVFTMFDFALYLLINHLLKRYLDHVPLLLATIVLTVAISFTVSVLCSYHINQAFYFIINKVRKHNGLSLRRSTTNWASAFATHGTNNQLVYLYGFDHKPLGWGWRKGISNDRESNYSISMMPQLDDSPEVQDSYEEVTKLIQQDNFRAGFEVTEYVNFQQGFIAIICNAKADKISD